MEKQTLKEFLLKNCLDKEGNITIQDLDLSDFKGEFVFTNLTTENDVIIEDSVIEGDLVVQGVDIYGSIFGTYNGAKNAYINDNVITGKFIAKGNNIKQGVTIEESEEE